MKEPIKKILECAKEAFIDKGFHGADIGYIASLVGVDKRTFIDTI